MPFISCPKCNHQPLPADQALPAACPGCGVIFAKLGERVARIAAKPVPETVEEVPAEIAPERVGLRAVLFHVPDAVDKMNWYGRISALAIFAIWSFFIWRDIDIAAGESGSSFLHAILIPFHEAGHYLIFRWFGQFIMTLGGTLGQHLLPIVLGVALLWKRNDTFGVAIFFWLLGYSVVDMGVYMYDAFDPKMMLLDGRTGADSDGHDWQNLFGDLGLLKNARGIGLFFGAVGRLMMASALVWAAWLIWLQRARLSESPFAETDLR